MTDIVSSPDLPLVRIGRVLVPVADLPSLIADDLASGVADEDDLPARYGLTATEVEQVLRRPDMKELLAGAFAKWHGLKNTPARVRAKSAVALEYALEALHAEATDDATPSGARIEAIKQLSRLSGLESKEGGGAGPGFSVTIHMPGAGRTTSIVEAKPVRPAVDAVEANDELSWGIGE